MGSSDKELTDYSQSSVFALSGKIDSFFSFFLPSPQTGKTLREIRANYSSKKEFFLCSFKDKGSDEILWLIHHEFFPFLGSRSIMILSVDVYNFACYLN